MTMTFRPIRNMWECAFCRRRSQADNRVVLTVPNNRGNQHTVRCCNLECTKRLLELWEELEEKKKGFK